MEEKDIIECPCCKKKNWARGMNRTMFSTHSFVYCTVCGFKPSEGRELKSAWWWAPDHF